MDRTTAELCKTRCNLGPTQGANGRWAEMRAVYESTRAFCRVFPPPVGDASTPVLAFRLVNPQPVNYYLCTAPHARCRFSRDYSPEVGKCPSILARVLRRRTRMKPLRWRPPSRSYWEQLGFCAEPWPSSFLSLAPSSQPSSLSLSSQS